MGLRFVGVAALCSVLKWSHCQKGSSLNEYIMTKCAAVVSSMKLSPLNLFKAELCISDSPQWLFANDIQLDFSHRQDI